MSLKGKKFVRIPVDTDYGSNLCKLLEASTHVRNAASLLAEELGAAEYTENIRCGAGGIGMLFFAEKPDETAYRLIEETKRYKEECNLFAAIPREDTKEGRAVLDKVAHLPMVPIQRMLKALCVKPARTPMGIMSPLFFRRNVDGKEYFYISTSGGDLIAEAVEKLEAQGMEPVEPQEFIRLCAVINQEEGFDE